MKLSIRFVLLVLVLLLGVAASATAGSRALTRLDVALDSVVKGDMERLLAITHTRRLFRSLVVLERDYLLSASADERKSMDKKLLSTDAELGQQLDKYSRLMPAQDRAALQSIRDVRKRWLELDEQVREAVRKGDHQALTLAAQHAKDPVSWEAVIGALVKSNEARLAGQVEATHVTYVQALRVLRLVSAAAALFAAAFGYVIFMGIRRAMKEVVDLNANLENLVKARTEALSARERSLRLVLDSTGDGIIGVQADGLLAGGSSAAAERWFGEAKAGEKAAHYLFPDDPAQETVFQMALDQLLEDFLPREVLLGQMPQRISRASLILELDYRTVTGDAGNVALLILVRDVTARVQSEKGELEAREQQALVGKLLSDKQGFATFVSDVDRLIASLETETNDEVLRRNLHTLKGNVAVFGMISLTRCCHALEDALELNGGRPSAADAENLRTLFRTKLQGIEEFLTSLGRNVVEVETAAHSALIESLLERKDYEEILSMVEIWSWPRTSEVLARLKAQVEYVATRLEKPVRVELEHNDLRIPAGYLERFWPTLTHVIRNAVDHGVESADVRAAHGKPVEARVTLRSWQTEHEFCLEIGDDGGGIDAEAVRRAALERGIKAPAGQSLVDLIFVDGLSTRSEVTDLSGRGVGLSATREACEAEGGQIEVLTETDRGTRFVFHFRRPIVKTDRLAANFERRWSLLPFPSQGDSATLPKATPLRAG